MCDMLFHTRLEWDDHKLSSDHLRKVGEQRRQFNPDLKDDEFELLDVIVIEDDIVEEMPVDTKMNMINDQEIKEEVEEEEEETVAAVDSNVAAADIDVAAAAAVIDDAAAAAVIDDAAAANIDVAAAAVAVKEESEGNKEIKLEADGDVDMEKETEVKKETEENDKEDPTAIKKEKEEKYNPANVVGRELVVKTGGHVCRLCSVFMKNDEEAELHCQTATHYINFISITKLHVSI